MKRYQLQVEHRQCEEPNWWVCSCWLHVVTLCICVCVCTSAGNSFRSTVCSEPQALLSPQWKWNWHSLNVSCRGPPFSAAAHSEKIQHSVQSVIKKEKKKAFFFLYTKEMIWERAGCSTCDLGSSYHRQGYAWSKLAMSVLIPDAAIKATLPAPVIHLQTLK